MNLTLISSFSAARVYDNSPVNVNRALLTDMSVAKTGNPELNIFMEAFSAKKAAEDEMHKLKVKVAITD